MNFTSRFYFLLAMVCLLGAVEQWMSQASSVWRYAAALLVVGVLFEWVRARLLVISLRAQNPISLHLGRSERVHIQLTHNMRRLIELQWTPEHIPGVVHMGGIYQQSVELAAESELALRAQELGATAWDRVAAKVKGELGLGWWPVISNVSEQIQVVPEVLASSNRKVGELSAGSVALQQGQGFELHHLRDYVVGDPLHTLSWKAMARQNKPITRVLQHEQHVEIIIVLDIGRTSRAYVDGLSQFGHYVNLAARLSELAVLNGDEVGLLAVADKPVVSLSPGGSRTTVARIRTALTGLRPLAVETNLLAAALRVQQMAQRRSLIILLTDMYAQDISSSFGQSLKAWRARHLPMVVGLIGDELRPESTEIQDEEDVYNRLAIQEYLQIVESNAQGARLFGAESIVTRPQELHDLVFERYFRLKRQRRV